MPSMAARYEGALNTAEPATMALAPASITCAHACKGQHQASFAGRTRCVRHAASALPDNALRCVVEAGSISPE